MVEHFMKLTLLNLLTSSSELKHYLLFKGSYFLRALLIIPLS